MADNSTDKNDREVASPPRKRRLLITGGIVVLLCGVAAYSHYKTKYPYGWSHACDKILSSSLASYAQDHDGNFPTGEPTAEACLSLLYQEEYLVSAQVLAGKNIDVEVAEQVLSQGQLLGPQTCGWHYVPGLSRMDDDRLALFWDKPGLGHNGEILDGGGHIVWFVSGSRRHITATEWDSFIAEQENLLKNAKDSASLVSQGGP